MRRYFSRIGSTAWRNARGYTRNRLGNITRSTRIGGGGAGSSGG